MRNSSCAVPLRSGREPGNLRVRVTGGSRVRSEKGKMDYADSGTGADEALSRFPLAHSATL